MAEATEWAIPVQTKTVHKIKWGDLESLVNETYGLKGKWDFVANEECSNDSDHEFSTEQKLADYQLKELEEFKGGKAYALQWSTGVILTDLANQGKIPHGDILVWVSW